MSIEQPGADGRAVGIDFGGTSVKIGLLPEILGDGGPEVIVLPTADYASVDDMISGMADGVASLREWRARRGRQAGEMVASAHANWRIIHPKGQQCPPRSVAFYLAKPHSA